MADQINMIKGSEIRKADHPVLDITAVIIYA